MLEHIAQQIAINQVELPSILTNIESSYSNVISLFAKLCDVTKLTKEIKGNLNKIDEDLKVSAQKLQLELSSSSAHHMKIRFLSDMSLDLLKEEARI